MNKQNVIYSYNGVIFGHKRNEVLIPTIIWMNFENVKVKKKHTNGHTLYDSIYMRCPE